MTPVDVVTHHVREAERYVAISDGWASTLRAEQRRQPANGVRIDRFALCVEVAAKIAAEHLAMAHAVIGALEGGRSCDARPAGL